ncbi:hypothetical protein PRUPE_1G475400 [Prunus persica]|uniref:BURP domain-containing protein n=1 Tax=Prunus persica TaxID=3760 RepID=A0A251REC9_PRUPE|nr:BURP domain-containing protein 5 [Prunus persica]ONI34332.1 hypothetical protein PRUPE_1G475400 [Prunus persica]
MLLNQHLNFTGTPSCQTHRCQDLSVNFCILTPQMKKRAQMTLANLKLSHWAINITPVKNIMEEANLKLSHWAINITPVKDIMEEANLKLSHWAINITPVKDIMEEANLKLSHWAINITPVKNIMEEANLKLSHWAISITPVKKSMEEVLLHPTINHQFHRNSNTATFLPRESAQSIPFSSNKLPEIFNHFSVKPTSEEAKTIKQTIEECEAPDLKGEEIYCATSLESMVDFSTSKLGTRNVEAISTEVLEKGATMSIQNYTTMPGLKKLAGDKVVVCHKQNYPYAVFFCHAIKHTAAYALSLKGDDGEKVKAVTICHLDTSEWDPEHMSFKIVNVKPGTIPICHFISTDAIAWVPNHKSA